MFVFSRRLFCCRCLRQLDTVYADACHEIHFTTGLCDETTGLIMLECDFGVAEHVSALSQQQAFSRSECSEKAFNLKMSRENRRDLEWNGQKSIDKLWT